MKKRSHKFIDRKNELHTTKQGFTIEIIEYFGCDNSTIRFEDGTVLYGKDYRDIKKGTIKKPINILKEIHITNEGYEVEIIEYFNNKNCTIKFKDSQKTILKNISLINLKVGCVKNPNHKSVCGIGYLGIGKYKAKVGGSITKEYGIWGAMLKRCYNKRQQKLQPTYVDCLVDERWHDFQNFAKWHEENYKPHMEDWHLDKDLLLKGNKTYSPDTCCLIPREINTLFKTSNKELPLGVIEHKNTGKYVAQINKDGRKIHIGVFNTVEEAFEAYKVEKECHIKETADNWKLMIQCKVYQAMYTRTVEMTD